jgi:uncharacterized membrane protein
MRHLDARWARHADLSQPSFRVTYLIVLALMLLGFMLRLSGLGRLDFWYDEIVLRNYALTGSALYTPTEAPLMAWILYAVMWWTKRADAFVIHLVAAILGSLVIPVAFVLAERVSQSRSVGIIAALLTALSPMAIYYSREARPYALLTLVSTALYWTFIRANERNTRSSWLIYAVVLAVCSLSHLLTIQMAAALGLFAVAQLAISSMSGLRRDERAARFRTFAGVSLAAGLAGSVWFIQRYFTDPAIQANQSRIFGSSVYSFGVPAFVRDAVVNLGPGPVGPRSAAAWLGGPELLGTVFLALFVAGLVQLRRQGKSDIALLFSLLVGVPLLIEYLTLGEKSSWDWMRWISHVVVPYLVVAGIGLHAVISRRQGRLVPAIGVAALAGILLPQALNPKERPDYQQNRDIAAYLQEHSGALQGVLVPGFQLEIVSPADQRILDTYYYLKRETLPVYVLSMGTIHRSVLTPTRGQVALLPRASDDPAGELESGRYAVLTRRPSADCEKVLGSLNRHKAVARHASPVKPGLTICDVEFDGAPN